MRTTCLCLLALGLPLAAQTGNQDAVKAVRAITLGNWSPDSSLVVAEHHPPKARFAVIDAHSHAYVKTPEQVAEWVRAMDTTGVQTTVILTSATGADFDRWVELFLKPYPTRFQLYCGLNTDKIDASDYPERAVAELMRCYQKGARGVGEMSDKGSGYTRGPQLPRDKRLHPDDPRLDLFWRKCAELKLPVNIHMADHPSAWRPADNHQERSPSFQSYNQYGQDVPSYEKILQIRDRLLARHPKTVFIACHFSNQGNDMAALSQVMDRFPNLWLDISARAYEIGREPRTAARFIERYQDRILFGTDQTPDKGMYLAWWRILETADEYIKGPNWWRLYGLELPDKVLEKLYRSNALKVLNWAKL